MMKRLLTAVGVMAVASLAGLGWLWNDYKTFLDTPAHISETRLLVIEKGTYFSSLAKQLEAESMIDEAIYLRVLSRLEPELAQIKAGEYELKPGVTPRQMLEKFAAGDTLSYRFTIVEGTRFSELRQALSRSEHLKQTIADMSDEALAEALKLDTGSPEGMFLAETYQFERGMSDLELLARAHDHLQKTLDSAWESRQEKLPLKTPYEALTLASIIEKETGVASERPRIAGVFIRRLERGMRLQTDPTVIYGMGLNYTGNIRRSDLHKKTPYNTYMIDGLPPTPIAMVGPDAIKAALNPVSGQELYFVARGDGSHHFSDTLAEHNKAVARFQLKRRENYRSSPGIN